MFFRLGFLWWAGSEMSDTVSRNRDGRTMHCWGAQPTWGGLRAVKDHEEPDNSHVEVGFRIPYDIGVIPIGKYVSNTMGATVVATTYAGCEVWPGTYKGEVGNNEVLF